MKSATRMALVAVMVLSVVLTGYRVVVGQCDDGCDKDRCLYIEQSTFQWVIDTRYNNAGDPVDCYLEFSTDETNNYYGFGDAGYGYCRYKASGTPAGDTCEQAQSGEYYEVSTFYCSFASWDGDWVFTCFDGCAEE